MSPEGDEIEPAENAGPLEGKCVLVTRRPEQASVLSTGLRGLGARVVEVPLIAVAEPSDPAPFDAALADLGTFDWLVLSSANAVNALADRLADRPEPRLPNALKVASVGPATTVAVSRRFPRAQLSLEPRQDFRAEGLLEAFQTVGLSGRRVLLPTSDRARDVLAAGLAARGAEVVRVIAYRTVAPVDLTQRLAAALAERVDVVVFASPSAVEGFVAAAGAQRPRAAVIGPVTQEAARRAGFDVVAVASPSTAEGLLAALVTGLGISH